jgi:hypothetical protein
LKGRILIQGLRGSGVEVDWGSAKYF